MRSRYGDIFFPFIDNHPDKTFNKTMNSLIPAFTGIFFPIILGLICRNGNFIDPKNRPTIQQFAIRIAIPFMVFDSLRTIDMKTAGQFIPMSVGLFIFTGLTWLFSWGAVSLISRRSPWFHKYKAELILMGFGGNVGYICWKLHELLIGPAGLQRGIFYTAFFWPVMMTYAFLTVWALKLHQTGKLDKKAILYNLAPLLFMIMAGLIFGIADIQTAPWLNRFTSSFGQMAVPIILFCMGLSISIKKSWNSALPLIPYLSIRLLIWIGTTFILLQLSWFDIESRSVLMINALAPLGVTPIVISDTFGLDSEFVANSITVSTVLFLMFLPLLFLFWT